MNMVIRKCKALGFNNEIKTLVSKDFFYLIDIFTTRSMWFYFLKLRALKFYVLIAP